MALSAGVAQAVPTLSSLTTVKSAPRRCISVCRLPPARSASPPGGLLRKTSTAGQGRAGGGRSGRGALVLALTPCYTCDPAREARMEQRIHEGILYRDQHKRYCLYEPGVPEHKTQTLTCTSGCRLEVWLNRAWIAGHVEGDGEDYWLFADAGGRFLLAEHMKARYTEHRWRSGMRDISGICSSPSIRITHER